jgi:hypothetical protein
MCQTYGDDGAKGYQQVALLARMMLLNKHGLAGAGSLWNPEDPATGSGLA